MWINGELVEADLDLALHRGLAFFGGQRGPLVPKTDLLEVGLALRVVQLQVRVLLIFSREVVVELLVRRRQLVG